MPNKPQEPTIAAAAIAAQRQRRWADRMSYIDILIPLVGALLLIAQPSIFLSKSTPPESVAAKIAKLRKCGYLLLAVAAVYSIVMLSQRL